MQHLQPTRNRSHEWVLWLDADAVLLRHNTRLEQVRIAGREQFSHRGIRMCRVSLSACALWESPFQFLPPALCADPANRCFANDIHMVVSDGGQFVLNSGVMLLRNHPWTRALLRVSACQTPTEPSLR